jgi:hypothetical protein
MLVLRFFSPEANPILIRADRIVGLAFVTDRITEVYLAGDSDAVTVEGNVYDLAKKLEWVIS